MNRYKCLAYFTLCFCMILSLIGCRQPETPVVASISAEETHASLDGQLATAQDLLSNEDHTSATTTAQVQEPLQEEDIPAPPAQIIDLDVSFLSFADSSQIGSVEIHRISAQERNGTVRYTIAYSAPSGMFIQLINGRLNHTFDVKTSGQQETITFEIPSGDIHSLSGSFDVKFAFSDEDFYLMKIITAWPLEDRGTAISDTDNMPDEFEVSVQHNNDLQDCEGTVESFTVTDVGDSWKFTISHSLPPDMRAKVFQVTNKKASLVMEEASATDTVHKAFQFEIPKEDVSQWESINVSFSSKTAGNYSAKIQIPFQIQKTFGTPIGEPVQTGYSIENELESGSYKIHDITAQRLNNGYVRFTMDMTLSDEMSIAAFLNIDLQKRGGNQFISDVDSSGQQTQYVLDIHEEQLAKSNYLYLLIQVGENDQNRFFVNIPHSCITAITDSDNLSATIPVDCYLSETVDKKQYQLHGCTAQILQNGYIRYTLNCTMPEETLCHFFDSMSDGNKVNIWYASGPKAEEQTIVVDIEKSVAEVETEFVIFADLFAEQIGAIFVINNAAVLNYNSQESFQDIVVNLVRPDDRSLDAMQ